jgi:hypothetical protein
MNETHVTVIRHKTHVEEQTLTQVSSSGPEHRIMWIRRKLRRGRRCEEKKIRRKRRKT